MDNTTTKPQSAQIIPLPGAASEPVVQQRKKGRHPKEIISLWRFRRDKNVALYQATSNPNNVEKCRERVSMAERILHTFKYELIQAQQQAARGQS